MPNKLYLARQPIFNHDGDTFAYELFYRDEFGDNSISDPRTATSSVLVNLLNQVGLHNVVGDKKVFINVCGNILMTDIIYNLPSDRFVFELAEDTVVTHKEIEAMAALHKLGFEFALDNVKLNSDYHKNFMPLMPYISYVKFDTTQTDVEELAKHLHLFESFTMIAHKVEIPEIYEFYRDLGFSCFQGHIFAKPEVIEQERLVPKHHGVIKLFNMLQHDASLNDLVEEFQKEHELSMQLLQYARSTATTKISTTSSIRDLLNFVGKKKLLQWLLLIIYAKSGQSSDKGQSPCIDIIERRTHVMLGIAERINAEKYREKEEEIRFLAYLSLIEQIFDLPLAAALESFEICDSIKDALLAHSGDLGRLFALALSIERNDLASTHILLKQYGLTIDDIIDIID